MQGRPSTGRSSVARPWYRVQFGQNRAMLDFDTQRKYFQRCNFLEPLDPDDDRNLDIDRLEADASVRGANWVDRLARTIELGRDDQPTCALFTGLPGSGKTTELRRLMARLEDEAGSNLLAVYVNARETLDLTNTVSVIDVIATVVYSAERRVLAIEGKQPARALEDGYLTRLWSWLRDTDIEIGKGSYNIPGVGNLLLELRTRTGFRERVRKAVSDNLTRFLDDAGDELATLNRRTRDAGRAGLAVVVDQLETLRGTTENQEEVLASAERLFSAGMPHLRLPVHVQYTIPPALLFRRFNDVHFMPMIKLRRRDGSRFEAGYEAARELVRRRIPDDVLQQMLGEQFEERIGRVIESSGGYPRELVRLLGALVERSAEPITDRVLDRVLADVFNRYRLLVPGYAFAWLAQVDASKFPDIDTEDLRQTAYRMLEDGVILCYQNDDTWFDLQPAVRRIPGVEQAIARLSGR